MNIFAFEFKRNIVSIVIWSVSIIAFLLFYMLFFPSFATDAALMDMLYESFPPEFLDAFGMNGDLPMHHILGYFALTYSFVELVVAIHAARLGFGVLSKEERELTADFLFTKPVSRKDIYMQKILSSLLVLFIVDIFTNLGGLLGLVLFNGGEVVEYGKVLLVMTTLIPVQLFFFSVGLIISMSLKKIKSVLPYAMGFGFGMYIVQSLGAMLKSDFITSLTPFGHFEPNYILANSEVIWYKLLISVGVITVSFIGSYFLYIKRNIPSL
jgi:ABC-2 type transport system permease protein